TIVFIHGNKNSGHCCGISNSWDRKEDHLIFDYDQLGPQTNLCNHIYIYKESSDISEGSSINTQEGSSNNIEEGSSDNMAESS
ncbi:13601_t:CDS:2, partial [Cetraspora pellucida]